MAKGTAAPLQGFLRALEGGSLAGPLRRILTAVGVLALAFLYLFVQFRGLSTPDGIDQAQVGRQLATGQGYTTKVYRPAAIHALQARHGGTLPDGLPETYHAPLNPLVNAAALTVGRATLGTGVDNAHPVYAADRVVAAAGVLLFLVAVFLHGRLARRLFDVRIAAAGTAFVLLADAFWQFSLSGLPQALLLALFGGALTFLHRALEAQTAGRRPLLSLALVGLLFGLMALAQPLTLFVALGAFVFCGARFRPRAYAALVPPLLCLAVLVPWFLWNARVSGTPFGTAPFAWVHDVIHTEAGWVRRPVPDFATLSPNLFRRRIQASFVDQLGAMSTLLGGVLVAPLFFVALLHRFKRPETEAFKWALSLMWAGAFVGTILIGMETKWLDPNQIHLLFGPAMTFYGAAFLLVVLGRLHPEAARLRTGLLAVVGLVTALPAIVGFLPGNAPIHFPPYLPGVLRAFEGWTKPDEVIVSDMPWAVSWYGNRKALWLPDKPATLNEYSDYGTLGGPVVMLYFSPLTRDLKFASELATGEYSDWTLLILGIDRALEGFPLRAHLTLAGSQCLLLADRPRWEGK